ncbi:roadblock/LC7 domain-containing protein [Deinococcus ficus]|uniref:roadblock/LC7 domain-containing protein n=1 Tax=Deinococcus ficus TaxID=317577 RepID=UPI00174EC07D|nr:roadblock/LC7 domain-containing protein [Deinococcus ficus]GHF68374.1 hypothetical protein GCM10017782_02530 [Deinococcus ficus]
MIAPLLAVRGVHHVALVSASGEVLTSSGNGVLSDPDVQGLVSAARAVIGSLKTAVGGERWNELLLDLESGPMLLLPHGDQVLLVAFDEVSNLGRVRFTARKQLGDD